MNRLAKSIFLSAAAAVMTLSSISVASADDRWRRGGYSHHHGNDAWVGGAVGLATGLIVGSAIASQPRYVDQDRYYGDPYAPPIYRAPRRVYVTPDDGYYAPPPRYYAPQVRYAPPVRAVSGAEPWSPQWARWCSYRYRSFDPRSGTFVGYDGLRHFCNAG